MGRVETSPDWSMSLQDFVGMTKAARRITRVWGQSWTSLDFLEYQRRLPIPSTNNGCEPLRVYQLWDFEVDGLILLKYNWSVHLDVMENTTNTSTSVVRGLCQYSSNLCPHLRLDDVPFAQAIFSIY